MGSDLASAADRVRTLDELGELLRRLRRRHARSQGSGQLTVRELAGRSGYAYGVISEYLNGKALAPTDRFDVLIRLLGAGRAEQRALATARDRVEELRRARRSTGRAPQELPPGVPGFTGRKRELADLDLMLDLAGPGREVAPISVVAGTAGVGKTTLVVHWGRQIRAEFPDGCLYVDLRGYDPGPPVAPAEVLPGFLRSLGLAGADIPPTEAERAARYRTLLADRRILVLLDNARGTAQIRPLLPGGPGCVTVVTSRDSLAGLVTRYGARRIRLEPLTCDEAHDLLAGLLGSRVTAEPDAAGALAERCARLPLTLRLVAQLADARPDASLAELAAELTDLRRRLDRLDAAGEPDSASRATFSWSYRSLPAPAARAFRLLGHYPGRDLDGYAMAALAGTGPDRARRLLRELARAHLVQPTQPDRYGIHDLLRAYAGELAAADPEPAALARLRDHHLRVSAAAMALVAPFDRDRRPTMPDPGRPVPPLPPLPDRVAATGWLDTERPNLIATALHAADTRHAASASPAASADHAADHGPGSDHPARLAAVLVRYLDTGAHYHDAELLYRRAAAVAAPADRAQVLTSLGVVCWRLGRYPEAAAHHEQALALAREHGDDTELGRALLGLGIVYWHLGRAAETIDCGEQALALYRRLDDRLGQARVLGNLASIHILRGEYPEAVARQRQALALFQAVGDPAGAGNALCNLGAVLEILGRLTEAEEHLQDALRLARSAGYRECEAQALATLGSVHLRQGRLPEALDHHQRALELVRAAGDRAAQGHVLGGLGTVYERLGQSTRAVDQHELALRIADEIGDRHLATELLNRLGDTLRAGRRPADASSAYRRALATDGDSGNPYQRARAHHGLARTLATTGEVAAAAPHWEQALTRYARLGVPEAEEVRAALAQPPASPRPGPGTGT